MDAGKPENNITITPSPEVDEVIAIAKQISSECSSNFAVVFEAAIRLHYRAKYLEPYPDYAHSSE
jgi:hypothetical protein